MRNVLTGPPVSFVSRSRVAPSRPPLARWATTQYGNPAENIRMEKDRIVPTGLKRFQHSRQLHFLTFSCYQRRQYFDSPRAREAFERTLEAVRQRYCFYVAGYVVMPEHVHLLVTEPEIGTLAAALILLKRTVAHRLGTGTGGAFLAATLL